MLILGRGRRTLSHISLIGIRFLSLLRVAIRTKNPPLRTKILYTLKECV
jgi:hypothetical protein